nr:septum formation initiator family protein [bacterium]
MGKRVRLKNAKKRIFAIVACIALVWCAFILVQQEKQLQALGAEHDALSQTQAELKYQNQLLSLQVKDDVTDDIIRRLVRQKLGWVLEGDIVFTTPTPGEGS